MLQLNIQLRIANSKLTLSSVAGFSGGLLGREDKEGVEQRKGYSWCSFTSVVDFLRAKTRCQPLLGLNSSRMLPSLLFLYLP